MLVKLILLPSVQRIRLDECITSLVSIYALYGLILSSLMAYPLVVSLVPVYLCSLVQFDYYVPHVSILEPSLPCVSIIYPLSTLDVAFSLHGSS